MVQESDANVEHGVTSRYGDDPTGMIITQFLTICRQRAGAGVEH